MNAVYDYTLVQEINLIGVGDDDEEEEEQEQGECDEEDKDQRKANVWPKEYHESEIKKSIINRLQTSSRLHRSNSSPEERTLRSNGYSSNIQYQSRSPVLLQARRSSVQFAKSMEGENHLQWSPGFRGGNSDARSGSYTTTTHYTNGSSDRRDSSSSSSSSASSSAATFFISGPESRRSTLAEWKKSLRVLAKLGSGSNVKIAQEMPHVIAATPPRSDSSPLCQNPNFNTRSSSSSSSSSSS